MEFAAEISETKQHKSSSGLDQTYTLKLKTNNPLILDLGKLPALTLFSIKIELAERVVEYGQDKVVKTIKPKVIEMKPRKKLKLTKKT